MSEQKRLLNELRIDRDAAPAEGVGWRRHAVTAALLGVVAIAAYWAGARPGTPSGESAVSAVAPVAAQPAALPPSSPPPAAAADTALSASGYITARRTATVASRITGQITEVVIEEGMAVEQGDVLARLDDKLVRVDLELATAQHAAALAGVQSAEAELNEAERVLKRVVSLEKTDYSSEAQLTEARAAVERLTAGLASARAQADVAAFQVKSAREQLELHVIRAPFTGVVTEKTAQPGEVVSPMSAGGGFTRTGICTIVDMDSLEIEVDVNEAFIARVTVGQGVGARLDAYPDWDIPAHVIAIIPSANREKATVRVRIGLDAEDPRILPEMGVKVAFRKS
jgi:RND family efflux transporter MFP subunit